MPAAPIWLLREADAAHVNTLTAAGHRPLIARLLALRGVRDAQEADAFLHPSLRTLPDPLAMADAGRAAHLLADAVQQGRKVCVYGDYDVDGITAAALLHGLCEALQFPVAVFLPDRFRDGYGLNHDRLRELCDQGVTLFVSVDCGTTAVDEIAAVRARGVDFIVCDHHQLGPTLPNASALLNPQRPDCQYPDKDLTAVGVALVLAQAVRRELDKRGWKRAADGISAQRLELKGLVELAALGTIADVARMQGLNRALCWHGLKNLGSTARPGIQALIEQSGKGLGADRVGFQLAPRINAVGRMSNPRDAFLLLTTRDPVAAKDLAQRLDLDNNRRKETETRDVEVALRLAEAQAGREHAVVVADAGFHQGVVGIVAARLRERLGVPAFVLARGDDGLWRGSGRSVDGYDLVAGLHACDAGGGLFERYGGHAHAAGVTMAERNLEPFRDRLQHDMATRLPIDARRAEIAIDAEIALPDANFDTLALLEALEPHGRGNPKPTLLVKGAGLYDAKVVGKDQGWVKAALVQAGRQDRWARLSLPLFGARHLFQGLPGRGELVDVALRLERNVYNGKSSVEAKVVAIRAAI
jgi:single-stranded-DNA-specific exonuclease